MIKNTTNTLETLREIGNQLTSQLDSALNSIVAICEEDNSDLYEEEAEAEEATAEDLMQEYKSLTAYGSELFSKKMEAMSILDWDEVEEIDEQLQILENDKRKCMEELYNLTN